MKACVTILALLVLFEVFVFADAGVGMGKRMKGAVMMREQEKRLGECQSLNSFIFFSIVSVFRLRPDATNLIHEVA